MTLAEERYADEVAAAVREDLVAHPPTGELIRIVARWSGAPASLEVHVLGADDEPDVDPDDAWHPLEWPGAAEESERAARLLEVDEVAEATAALTEELDGGTWPLDPDAPPDALVAAMTGLDRQLHEVGFRLAGHFATGVAHVDGWGAAASVPRCNPPETVAALEEHGLTPTE